MPIKKIKGKYIVPYAAVKMIACYGFAMSFLFTVQILCVCVCISGKKNKKKTLWFRQRIKKWQRAKQKCIFHNYTDSKTKAISRNCTAPFILPPVPVCVAIVMMWLSWHLSSTLTKKSSGPLCGRASCSCHYRPGNLLI